MTKLSLCLTKKKASSNYVQTIFHSGKELEGSIQKGRNCEFSEKWVNIKGRHVSLLIISWLSYIYNMQYEQLSELFKYAVLKSPNQIGSFIPFPKSKIITECLLAFREPINMQNLHILCASYKDSCIFKSLIYILCKHQPSFLNMTIP